MTDKNHIVVGLNHQTAPVELREKLAVSPEVTSQALKTLLKIDRIEEGLILSTCNRVEVYAVTNDAHQSMHDIQHYLTHLKDIPHSMDDHLFYKYQDLDAIRHLFRVASSMDSMIVGEPQIVGQVKEAFQKAQQTETTGLFLNRLLHRAFYVAKKVRNETKIAHESVSVGAAAVQLAGKIFGDLAAKKVVLIGAGEIGELIVTYLQDKGIFDVAIVNRTLEKAIEIASDGFGQAYALDQLKNVLKEADLVISSIHSDSYILNQKQQEALMTVRKNRPMFIIDLGVPRNIDPAINKISNVYLYNIDDLKRVVESNKSLRHQEAHKAEEIIDIEAKLYYQNMVHERPMISSLGKKFDYIRKRELEKTLSRLSHLSDKDKKAIQKCTEAIINRIMLDPALLLKSDHVHHHDWSAQDLLKKLFRLDDEETTP